MSRRVRRRLRVTTGSVFFDVLPLLSIPMMFYNVVVFTGIAGSADQVASWMVAPAVTLPMFSGSVLNLSASDIILFCSMPLMFFEIIKSARTDSLTVLNHSISTLTLVVAVVEFVAVKGFSTAVFCLLALMQLVDVIAGFTVTIAAARRDLGGTRVVG
ncbi:MAG: hypothetical protein GC190_19610 [Alphaproteobacteria bacterium]|nr:hypothetical protein [Alphaproteobacteria bacterium]